MKQDRSNMDCAACGKPLSVTAKFCGKCGAPSVRQSPAPNLASSQLGSDDQATINDLLESAPTELTTPSESVTAAANVNELVVNLSPPSNAPDDSKLLKIDLNLEPPPLKKVLKPTVTITTEPAKPTVPNTEWQDRLEKYQHELKKTLEKHSLLLDFISLASQQQSHLQTQPDPNEPLLHNLIEQQTQLSIQLKEWQNKVHLQSQTDQPLTVPEELKLMLATQQNEIQKSFSQNTAQTIENISTALATEMAKVEEMLKTNTLTLGSVETNLAPLIQSVNDLKTTVHAMGKKVEAQASAQPGAQPGAQPSLGGKAESASEGGGFMIFIIGMLCGLTVVLSSLAIYNFLSHDKVAAESSAKSHEKAVPDDGAKAKSDH